MGRAEKIIYCVLAKLYGLATKYRNFLYDTKVLPIFSSKLPVISIGNLTVGGNGKTPLCIFLAAALAARGYKPVILSRGYRGKTIGPRLVLLQDPPALVGDEPLLMLRQANVPVVVARDRVAGAKFIEKGEIGDLIILDDGFQHRRLARTVDIVVQHVGTPAAIEDFLSGDLLPRGRFREDRDRGLGRADIVVFSERTVLEGKDLDRRLLRILSLGSNVYRSSVTVESVQSLSQAEGKDVALEPCEIKAFCALANPESFFDTLKSKGFILRSTKEFRDHYFYRKEDLQALKEASPDLPLVCSAKDAVKINPSWVNGLYVLASSTKVTPSDAFIVDVLRKIK